MIDHYDWPGGREAMLRFGPAAGPVVVVAMPLFEEANRTRAFIVTICRALAERGVASVLPDLPGQGESIFPLVGMTLDILRDAFAAAAAAVGRPHIVALRSGTLLTGSATGHSRWLFAPTDGDGLVRELRRTRQMADRESADTVNPDVIDDDGPPIEFAGNAIARVMLRDLRHAIPDRTPPSRLLRLASDPADADRKIEASPLWRRAEPDNDPALAALLADDIAAWIARCEG